MRRSGSRSGRRVLVCFGKTFFRQPEEHKLKIYIYCCNYSLSLISMKVAGLKLFYSFFFSLPQRYCLSPFIKLPLKIKMAVGNNRGSKIHTCFFLQVYKSVIFGQTWNFSNVSLKSLFWFYFLLVFKVSVNPIICISLSPFQGLVAGQGIETRMLIFDLIETKRQ